MVTARYFLDHVSTGWALSPAISLRQGNGSLHLSVFRTHTTMCRLTTHPTGPVLAYGANNSMWTAIIIRWDEQPTHLVCAEDGVRSSLLQHHQFVLTPKIWPQSREHPDWNVFSTALKGSARLDRILEGT